MWEDKGKVWEGWMDRSEGGPSGAQAGASLTRRRGLQVWRHVGERTVSGGGCVGG